MFSYKHINTFPVSKIAEKAVCRRQYGSVFSVPN